MTANRLYFSQHGLAVSKADDPERPLSEDGTIQTQSVANQLLTAQISISHIFHSNKLRAKQTAEIFASILNAIKISEIENLSPNDDVSLIEQSFTLDNALYVGHLPHMEKLVSHLVSGDENASVLKFQNSAVACIEKRDPLFQIVWYITPLLTLNI